MNKNRGLGKGLSALLGESSNMLDDSLNNHQKEQYIVPLTEIYINSDQPRKIFNEDKLSELSESIKMNGLIQPIVVRKLASEKGKYQIIAGERRYRACKLLKMKEVPINILELDDQAVMEVSILENIQRQDLSPLEEAEAYSNLIKQYSYTQETLAKKLGKSRPYIANMLRLLGASDKVKSALESGKVTMGHARAIVSLENQDMLLEQIINNNLTVRELENKVSIRKNAKNKKTSTKKPQQHMDDEDIQIIEDNIAKKLGMNVNICDSSNEKGKLIIEFGNIEQLDLLIKKLTGEF